MTIPSCVERQQEDYADEPMPENEEVPQSPMAQADDDKDDD